MSPLFTRQLLTVLIATLFAVGALALVPSPDAGTPLPPIVVRDAGTPFPPFGPYSYPGPLWCRPGSTQARSATFAEQCFREQSTCENPAAGARPGRACFAMSVGFCFLSGITHPVLHCSYIPQGCEQMRGLFERDTRKSPGPCRTVSFH